jgi:exosortase D (VPLPA-CTERM-specific)
VNQLAPTSPSIRSPNATRSPVPLWQIAVLAALLLWLYWATLAHLVVQWWHDPNFSHGFFVPLFSAFVVWLGRNRLARLALRPSWSGLAVLAFALCVLIVGFMGAELFLARFSLLLVLASLIVLFLGWNFFRALLFPWAFLILMIPIPAIVFNEITLPLQLLASNLAAASLRLLGVPVLREGNVINLPSMALEVAEACSGIRSLMSLVTLAIVYGFLLEKRLWVRWLLALTSVPIAVAANSVRIIGTGLLVQYWNAGKAEGYFHASWGWIIFVVSLLLLYAVHGLTRLLWREEGVQGMHAGVPQVSPPLRDLGTLSSVLRFVLPALLIIAAAVFLQRHTRSEVFPPRLPLQSFPQQLGTWTGADASIDPDVLAVLGPGDFLLRVYHNQEKRQPEVEVFLAYFPSQRTGDTIHSPKNCLPGAGWTPLERRRVMLALPGHAPFPANRYIIAKGDAREFVLYWYWAHDRGIASEYWAKYYLVADSIAMNRSDGALVRLTTAMYPGETADAAQQRLLPLAVSLVPLLNSYVPR